jgi:hypothetical protein
MCSLAVPIAGTFYPSTGMSLKQRCINTAATFALRALARGHRYYGPMKELADRQVRGAMCQQQTAQCNVNLA